MVNAFVDAAPPTSSAPVDSALAPPAEIRDAAAAALAVEVEAVEVKDEEAETGATIKPPPLNESDSTASDIA